MAASALAAPPAASTRDRRLGPMLALAVIFVLSIAPVVLVDIPAMVDYPNHLARMSILARAGTPAANPYYDVVWAPYPNLAMDLLVPPLTAWMSVETATRLFYLAAQALIVSGAMALSYAVRRRTIAAGICACGMLYSTPFAWGFVNFEFGLGLALWAAAAWIGSGPERPVLRFAVHAAAVPVLLFAHLIALGIYGLTIGLVELGRAYDRAIPLPRLALTGAAMAAPALAVAAWMMGHGGAVGGEGSEWLLAEKPNGLLPINGYNHLISKVLGVALVFVVYAANRSGWLRFDPLARWVAGGFLVAFLLMPFRLFDTAVVDVRVAVAAILIVPAFVELRAPPGGRRLALGGLVAACLIANLAHVGIMQSEYRTQYAEVTAALARVPRGAKLFAATTRDEPDPPPIITDYPMYHAVALAAYERDAFVATLFAAPGKQPISPKAAVRHLALQEGGPVMMRALEAVAAGAVPPPEMSYIADWTHDFDYLLLIRPTATDPLPANLEPVARGRRFVLYRVRPARPGAPAAGGYTQP